MSYDDAGFAVSVPKSSHARSLCRGGGGSLAVLQVGTLRAWDALAALLLAVLVVQ